MSDLYQILVNYNTGDSFHHEQGCETIIDYWDEKTGETKVLLTSLDIGKINLQRINDHYKTYLDLTSVGLFSLKKQELDKIKSDLSKQDWYSGKNWEYGIILLDNEKNKISCHVNWTGYFESMNFAELQVQPKVQTGMRIEFN